MELIHVCTKLYGYMYKNHKFAIKILQGVKFPLNDWQCNDPGALHVKRWLANQAPLNLIGNPASFLIINQ